MIPENQIISLTPCDSCAKYKTNLSFACQCDNILRKDEYEKDLKTLIEKYLGILYWENLDDKIKNDINEFMDKWSPK